MSAREALEISNPWRGALLGLRAGLRRGLASALIASLGCSGYGRRRVGPWQTGAGGPVRVRDTLVEGARVRGWGRLPTIDLARCAARHAALSHNWRSNESDWCFFAQIVARYLSRSSGSYFLQSAFAIWNAFTIRACTMDNRSVAHFLTILAIDAWPLCAAYAVRQLREQTLNARGWHMYHVCNPQLLMAARSYARYGASRPSSRHRARWLDVRHGSSAGFC